MQDKLVASMASALHMHSEAELTYEQCLEVATAFLNALADNLPDEMVEAGAEAIYEPWQGHCDPYFEDANPAIKADYRLEARSCLIAALKGAV